MSDETQTVATDDAAELRRLRMQLGATQAEVGCMLGVSRSAISHWERGDNPVRPLPLQRLSAICTVHDASVRGLLAVERKQAERFKGLWNEAQELAAASFADAVELRVEVEQLKEECASLRRGCTRNLELALRKSDEFIELRDPGACRRWLINAACERVAEWAEGAAPPVSQMREALEVLRMAEGER